MEALWQNNFYEKISNFLWFYIMHMCPRLCPRKWPAIWLTYWPAMWLSYWLTYCSSSDCVPVRIALVRMRKSRLCPAYCPGSVFGSPIASPKRGQYWHGYRSIACVQGNSNGHNPSQDNNWANKRASNWANKWATWRANKWDTWRAISWDTI